MRKRELILSRVRTSPSRLAFFIRNLACCLFDLPHTPVKDLLGQVPDQVLSLILHHLDPIDLCVLSSINRFWNNFLRDEEYWKHVIPSWCITPNLRHAIVRSGCDGVPREGKDVWRLFEKDDETDKRGTVGMYMKATDAETAVIVLDERRYSTSDTEMEWFGRTTEISTAVFRNVPSGGFYTASFSLALNTKRKNDRIILRFTPNCVEMEIRVGLADEYGIIHEPRFHTKPAVLVRGDTLIEEARSLSTKHNMIRVDCSGIPVEVPGDSVSITLTGIDCPAVRLSSFELVPHVSHEDRGRTYTYHWRSRKRSVVWRSHQVE